ncbi:NAD(+) diphosphatase [Rugosimonospora africana]|uniref:NAD(+) diphosphatase n=1 Tax=Rugosimonospora africana TaxID=556532 RepID=UPI001941E9A7|nr:NAD(+) diphosphatase [Rugosimonospora africana]
MSQEPSREADVPPLSRTALQRVAHRRTDSDWLAEAWKRAKVLVVDGVNALFAGGRLVLLDSADAPDGDRIFLGEDEDGAAYFAVLAPLADVEGARPATIREIGHELDALEGGLLITAIALANWHGRHQFSPRDGEPTIPTEAGWARVGKGGDMHWPRTDPAVIMLVHDGTPGEEGRCLLGHNAAWTSPGWVRRYSCLAGFVEAGESAEAAVVREVGEEVGVRVTRLRYVGSQSWPYPGSLMLGFTAQADPEEPVRVDEDEIASARWFTRAEVRGVLNGERSDFGLPMASSIAYFLLNEWLAGNA